MIFSKVLKWLLFVVLGLAVLASGLVVYLRWFQPAFYFPKPTGQYAVGVKDYHWIDSQRKETLFDDSAHPNRELMVTIWYPSTLFTGQQPAGSGIQATTGAVPAQGVMPEKPTTPYAPYLLKYLKKHRSMLWIVSGLSRPIYVYAQPDTALLAGTQQFPVILCSHGFNGTRDTNTVQCEELASYGYIVVGISHTYDGAVVAFPDGRVVDGLDSIGRRMRCQGTDSQAFARVLEHEVPIWLDDTRFVLDQLEKLDNDVQSPFYRRIDLRHIGIFGHSFGGSNALQACRNDARVKACVNLDGALFGSDVTKPLGKPCMMLLGGNEVRMHERPLTAAERQRFGIHSDDEEKTGKAAYLTTIKQLARASARDFYVFALKDAGHMDFGDLASYKMAFWPLRFWGSVLDRGSLHIGSIDGARATQIVNAYLVNFFDKYLRDKPSQLLDSPTSQYPEIEIERWK